MSDELGPWTPLAIDDVRQLLAGSAFPWWIAGGHALELHLGRSWRTHADMDIGIRRCDAPALLALLGSSARDGEPPWEVWIAADGRLHA